MKVSKVDYDACILEQISSIEEATFCKCSDKYNKNELKNMLNDDKYIFYVIGDEKIYGYCIYMLSFDVAELIKVAVDIDCRNRGYAFKLLDESLKDLEDVNEVFLEVRASNTKAISLYKKMGYKNIHIRKNLYDRPREDGLVMLRKEY